MKLTKLRRFPLPIKLIHARLGHPGGLKCESDTGYLLGCEPHADQRMYSRGMTSMAERVLSCSWLLHMLLVESSLISRCPPHGGLNVQIFASLNHHHEFPQEHLPHASPLPDVTPFHLVRRIQTHVNKRHTGIHGSVWSSWYLDLAGGGIGDNGWHNDLDRHLHEPSINHTLWLVPTHCGHFPQRPTGSDTNDHVPQKHGHGWRVPCAG